MATAEQSIVALIDVQGKLASLMHEREELYRQLQIFLRGARILDVPILWLEQYPKGLGPTVDEIREVLDGLQPVEKTCFSAWGAPAFREALAQSGRRHVVVAGIEAHVCVYQTVRDLLGEGFSVDIVQDAVSSRTQANRAAGLDRMQRLGAGLTTVEMQLFDWLHDASSPHFKEISRLVR